VFEQLVSSCAATISPPHCWSSLIATVFLYLHCATDVGYFFVAQSVYATLHLKCQENCGFWCGHWFSFSVSALTLLRILSFAAGRWSERVDHQIVVEEKEIYWKHEYGSAAIFVHGESGTGAAWRHRVGSFCGDRQVQIPLSTLIVYFEVSHSEKHSMIFFSLGVECGLFSSLLLYWLN
jgi:hypothetical protein